MFQFYFLTIYLKKVVWRLRILFMSDIVLSASRYTVLFDLFAVHEIPNILPGYLISDAFTLICSYFEIVQNSHLEIQNGFNIVLQAFSLIWIEMYFVSTEVIAWKSVFAFAILHKISVLLRRSHDIKVSKYLKWLLCLGLFLLMKMLICGHSLFRLTTIISVFLLLYSNPFFFSNM